jgi:hypothetical protein
MSKGGAEGSQLDKLNGLSEGLENGCFDGMSKGEAKGTRLGIEED